jgi:hypothetical protein
MILKSMLIWLSITPLAILNGAFRQLVLEPWIGENIARPISGIILCILIFIISFILVPKLGMGTKKIYSIIGILWVFSTIIFETIIGLIMGSTFTEIVNAYDITTGNLWLIIVIYTGFIPIIIAKIRRLYGN